MIKIAPSILSADFSQLHQEIKRVEAAGADMLHIDVMDGHFVPNLTIGPPVIKAIRTVSKLPFDVHLMIAEPERLIPAFIDAGADYLTIHIEATAHAHKIIQTIKSAKVKAGIAINPATPLVAIEELLADLDLILLMSVNPGFGGQQFIPATVDKVRRLKSMLMNAGVEAEIAVDGGVNAINAPTLITAGARMLVAGSYIYNALDCRQAIDNLKQVK